MTFLWQELLWLFLGVPVLVAAYVVLLRARAQRAVRYSAIGLFGAQADATGRLRTHVPALLLLAAICAFLLAGARPVVGEARNPDPRTLILMLDVSYSMGAADVPPSRLLLAQQIAIAVAERQPEDVLVGLIAFSSHAQLVHAPSASRSKLRAAIRSLELQSGSALGSGLLGSLMTIFPEHDLARGYDVFGHQVPRFAYAPSRDSGKEASEAGIVHRQGRAPSLARIVVLSDGQSTHGVPLERAIAVAIEYGVPVSAVGIGSRGGGTVEVLGYSYHVGLDETNLAGMATRTGGRYWKATGAADMPRLLQHMEAATVYEPRTREVGVFLSAFGLCLLLAAAALALRSVRRRRNSQPEIG